MSDYEDEENFEDLDVYGDEYEDVDGEGDEGDEEDEDLTSLIKKFKEVKLVHGNARTTPPYMTRFEYPRLVEAMAKLIASGVPVDPRLSPYHEDTVELARMAIEYRDPTGKEYRLPLQVRRPKDDGSEEVWEVHELELPGKLQTLFM